MSKSASPKHTPPVEQQHRPSGVRDGACGMTTPSSSAVNRLAGGTCAVSAVTPLAYQDISTLCWDQTVPALTLGFVGTWMK